MSLADSLQRRWYEDAPPPWWTRPLAALFGMAGAIRRALYRRGWLQTVHLGVPVVVVGNLTVGGTGKTPLVIALVEDLRGRGFKPGVVSRGYGGSATSPRIIAAQPDPRVTGDEAALVRTRTGVPVAVGADRVGAARLLEGHGVDVIVADDGLQHYALGRDIEICVIDGARRFGNGRLLPAGPLREPPARLGSVDFVVCNGGESTGTEVPMRLVARDAVALAEPLRTQPLAAFAGARVHAVAGIGHPGRFFDSLRAAGVDVEAHPFPDHHTFTAEDLAFGDGLPVLMTEKDAVKCRGFACAGWWSLPVTAELPAAFLDAVADRLAHRG